MLYYYRCPFLVAQIPRYRKGPIVRSLFIYYAAIIVVDKLGAVFTAAKGTPVGKINGETKDLDNILALAPDSTIILPYGIPYECYYLNSGDRP